MFHGIHVDLYMDVFSYKAKISFKIVASPLNINDRIFSLNKLIFPFFSPFYLGNFVFLCIWMVIEVLITCGYYTFWLKALHIFN
jgi:hypothetical protein